MGKYRTFSIDKVIETIKHLRNSYNCSHFVFHDDELPSERAEKISEAILNNNLKNISIYTYARLTGGYNSNKVLGYLSKAGFSTIAWGIESGSQRVLNLMNKGTKVSEMSQILKKSSKNGIANLCFIFFGFPGETKREAHQTIKFLKNHADYIEEVMSGVFVHRLSSPIEKNPEKWGIDIKKYGSYSNKNGMSAEEARVIHSKFAKEVKINSIKINSDKLKYLLPGFNRRMLHFLNSSYRLLSKITLLGRLKKRKLNSIFPIILGEIKREGNRNIFRPIKINETCFINQYHPEKEKVLDMLEEKIFILFNGTLSIEDISLAIYNDFKGKYSKEYVHKKCIDYFRDLFSKDFGLAFAKSWR